jgi:hypothetical protein
MRYVIIFPLAVGSLGCAGGQPAAPSPPDNLFTITPDPAARPKALGSAVATPVTPPARSGARVGPAVSLRVIPQVIAGHCAIKRDQTLHCQQGETQISAPPGKFVTINNLQQVYCGVREDQSAVCWLRDAGKLLPMPPGGFLSIVVSGASSARDGANFCGIRPTGDAECWKLTRGGAEISPVAHEVGKFVQAALGSYELHLLDETGMVKSVKTQKNIRNEVSPSGGTFTEISDKHRVRSDGALVATTLEVIGNPRSDLVAHTEHCDLRRDGSIECFDWVREKRRGTVYPGPFVMLDGGCAVRPDGRLKPVRGGCPAAPEAWVPDILKNRIAPPAESVALKNFNAFERLRASGGTPREYRVAFSSHEHLYLEFERRGATMGRHSEALLDGHVTPVIGEQAHLTLVDLNGGEIQLGDPIHIKHGGQFAAIGAAPAHRVQLVPTPTPAARFTIHSFNPYATAEDNYGPIERGLANVLIRSSTGEFMIPCAGDVCEDPPARAGVRPAGVRDDLAPFWVKDPRFSDVDDDGTGWFLQAGWTVSALVECPDGGVRKKSGRACEVLP